MGSRNENWDGIDRSRSSRGGFRRIGNARSEDDGIGPIGEAAAPSKPPTRKAPSGPPKAASLGFHHKRHPDVSSIWDKIEQDYDDSKNDYDLVLWASRDDMDAALGRNALTVVTDKGYGYEVAHKDGRYVEFHTRDGRSKRSRPLIWEVSWNDRMTGDIQVFLSKIGLYDYRRR